MPIFTDWLLCDWGTYWQPFTKIMLIWYSSSINQCSQNSMKGEYRYVYSRRSTSCLGNSVKSQPHCFDRVSLRGPVQVQRVLKGGIRFDFSIAVHTTISGTCVKLSPTGNGGCPLNTGGPPIQGPRIGCGKKRFYAMIDHFMYKNLLKNFGRWRWIRYTLKLILSFIWVAPP